MTRHRALLIPVGLAAAVALSTACSGSDDPDSRISVSMLIGEEPFDVADLTAPRNADGPDVPGNVVVRGPSSTCSTAGAATGLHLTGADVLVGAGGDGVATRVTWKLSAPVPTYGLTLLVFTATSADATTSFEVRYTSINGEQFEYSVLDDRGKADLTDRPDTSVPRQVSAIAPSDKIVTLGAGFHWSTTLITNTQVVNSCPG